MSFLFQWLNIIRKCNVDNTYKMAWAKAITEISFEIDYNIEDEYVRITLEQIANKVLKYYWEQTIYFDMIQGSNPNKPPKIIQLTKELIQIYQERTKSRQPIKFYKSNVDYILEKDYKTIVKKIVSALKQDVSYRFMNLGGTRVQEIYEYEKGKNELLIKKDNLQQLKNNYLIVFDTINYRWTQILEGFNHTPRISRKVRIIDIEEVRRKPLNRFKRYIELENYDHFCFICGKKIVGETLSIDHIIPWSFLYDDNIWNLVYAHKGCNSSKSNLLPDEEMINRLELRNTKLLSIMKDKGIGNKTLFDLENAIEHNLVKKYWISCQG